MGVQLNIKDPETVRLARELAGATKRSVTETIRSALEREKTRQDEEIAARNARIRAATAASRADLPAEHRNMTSKEMMDLIYNTDDGLSPR